ncbi:type III-A CRISPR-associated RAMP protein Csm4 [Bacteroides heparinolyticus]|uniref:CRISPR system Cms protein Csm4 n=1 Tax=Prevotella heparinolytica TaxID=28113 RepID=A0A2R3MTD4_9BACE|nr:MULTISPECIES: type III-A CRISPR-associated RAMP protein Csm4 [Bacteroides]AVM58261.1 type III-A CRISPR-associated RAMP protein Csm4 [Bacteroides heparinolyticus]TCO89139.1 CRISPR-associated Csm4 family protein [Bacteroides heparinolyticus]VFB13836.1 CRISPR type III-A/MTUBE-associated RAMP protein Csm4 [Bacteroides heparinolyticus]
MATSIFVLKDLTPLHIGTGRENYDFSASDLHSDTLSAALASMLAHQGKADEIARFLNSFVISSAFPFMKDQFFLPKPQGKIKVTVPDQEQHLYRKRLKKIRFIEASLWNRLMNGETLEMEASQLQDAFLTTLHGFEKPFESQVMQRVTIPRKEGEDAAPFFFDWTYFHAQAGLYCIVEAEESVMDRIEELFKMLGEFGLGTDRSVGGGMFEVERVKDRQLFLPANSPNASMLLSLYIPTKQEVELLDLPNSKYELMQRSGYMAGSRTPSFRHLRKKSIYCFNVGSVFNTTEALHGKIVDMQPDWNDKEMHPVFRSGKPFVVPVKMDRDE